ncbi:MAG: thioredoxin domain-containing protein [Gemmatimonadota bacterium]
MAAVQGGLNRFYTVIGVIGVLGLGVIGYMALKGRETVSIPADVTVLASDTAGFRGYLLGSDSAPVEITEYADFQCPGCQQFETLQFPIVRRQLIDTGRLRWRYRDFPLDNIHNHTRVAAHSAACADDQGKYWDQHRLIYEGQPEWFSASNAGKYFRQYAGQAGLDLGRYDECMKSARFAGRIQASHDEAIKVGVGVTPTFLIAGRLYPGGMNSDALKRLIDSLAPLPATP